MISRKLPVYSFSFLFSLSFFLSCQVVNFIIRSILEKKLYADGELRTIT